jgi:hypothetical protein
VLCSDLLNIIFGFYTRLQYQWKEAIKMAEILLKENNWSRATSCYLLATFQFENNNTVATDEIIQLYKYERF